ncbi:MAG: DUF2155 domain-containing protein [Alphaproteobacteria bacterium]|nr:MAG: DUF2155 domain-containing protein [Alphaproteobacteria bacterium]
MATGLGDGARLRGLDFISRKLTDITLPSGGTGTLGRLEIRLGECRYPIDAPASDAFAWLEIRDRRSGRELFRGWMIASSPALMALDNPRYDVWLLGCTGLPAEADSAPASE